MRFAMYASLILCGSLALAQQPDPILSQIKSLVQQGKNNEAMTLAGSLLKMPAGSQIAVQKNLLVNAGVCGEAILACLKAPEFQKQSKSWREEGDAFFESGNLEQAGLHWQRAWVLNATGARWLNNPELEFGEIPHQDWFRWLLLDLFQEPFRFYFQPELGEFLKKHGKETTEFLGRQSSYKDVFLELESRSNLRMGKPASSLKWNATRNPQAGGKLLPEELSSWCSDGPAVKLSIALPEQVKSSSGNGSSSNTFGLTWKNQLLFQDSTSLRSVNFENGSVNIIWGEPSGMVDDSMGLEPSLCMAAPDRMFAILGVNPKENLPETRFLAVQMERKQSRLLYASPAPGESSRWVSGPLLLGNRVVAVAKTRVQGKELYRVHVMNSQSAVLDVLSSLDLPAESNPDARFAVPVQLAGFGSILLISTASRLLAIDLEKNIQLWSRIYPSTATKVSKKPANRILAHQGLIYHLSEGGLEIECVSVLTGLTLWRREIGEPLNILGAVSGNLLLEPSRGVRALNLRTGLDASGWLTPNDFGNIHSEGSGFFSEKFYYWPTNHGFLVLDCQTGRPAADVTLFSKVGRGSVFYCNRGLIVVNDSQISFYSKPEYSGTKLMMPSDHGKKLGALFP